jgi:hypothetical protein
MKTEEIREKVLGTVQFLANRNLTDGVLSVLDELCFRFGLNYFELEQELKEHYLNKEAKERLFLENNTKENKEVMMGYFSGKLTKDTAVKILKKGK